MASVDISLLGRGLEVLLPGFAGLRPEKRCPIDRSAARGACKHADGPLDRPGHRRRRRGAGPDRASVAVARPDPRRAVVVQPARQLVGPFEGVAAVARAIWSGVMSFGLVSVPIEIYSATEAHEPSF